MKFNFAGWLVLLMITATSSVASESPGGDQFDRKFQVLEKQYDAPEISEFFVKAQRNLDGYIAAILMQRCATEHSYPCLFRYREALEAAKNHDLKSSKTKIEESKSQAKGLSQHACIADIWMASALINRALGKDEDALDDLSYVYRYRQNHLSNWTDYSDMFGTPPVRFPKSNQRVSE